MIDSFTPTMRHRIMAAIHSSNTKPEVKLRHALWGLGYRYRINDKHLPGSPDIVLPKYRSVIFVNGCFWHGHKGCKYYTVPQTNTDFWVAKVKRNQERDQEVWRKLEAKGWSVIIVWECELEKSRLQETVAQISAEIKANGTLYQQRQEERRAERERRRFERAKEKADLNAWKKELSEKFDSLR